MEQQHGKPDHDPDEVVELDGLADLDAEKFGTGDAENAVRAAGQAEHVVDQGDADDFHDADGHDEQVVAAQVDDGPGAFYQRRGIKEEPQRNPTRWICYPFR